MSIRAHIWREVKKMSVKGMFRFVAVICAVCAVCEGV